MVNIGIEVSKPGKECDDVNCPFHGRLKVRGQVIEAKVVSSDMKRSVVVERSFLRYVTKFERYERRFSRILAHNPACISAKEGDRVKIAECRPISKGKSFAIVEKGA